MALRLIEIMLPDTNAEQIEAILPELRSIGCWCQDATDNLTLVRVLAEAEQVEGILQTLEEKFAHHAQFRAMLLEVTATSPALAPPEEEAAGEQAEDEDAPAPERIACLELSEKLADGGAVSLNYILSVVLSAVVAAVGLMRDNVAIIIGAMVIAPLLRPNMALALATTLGDAGLARRALKANLAGLGVALGLAAATGFGLPVDPRSPEIAARAAVGYSDVILALAAGCAGALAFTAGVSEALVGVMVAVALLPPLVAAGLLLGAGYPAQGVHALLLTLTNIICVNLAGVAMFLLQGIRPRHYWEAQRASRMVKIAVCSWAGLLALLIAVIFVNQRFGQL
jgi:uncharacterized hydrophobic protein (TIGR00341 family)